MGTPKTLTGDDIEIPDGAYGATVFIWICEPEDIAPPEEWTWRYGFGRGVHDGVQWYDNLYFRHFGEGEAGLNKP